MKPQDDTVWARPAKDETLQIIRNDIEAYKETVNQCWRLLLLLRHDFASLNQRLAVVEGRLGIGKEEVALASEKLTDHQKKLQDGV